MKTVVFTEQEWKWVRCLVQEELDTQNAEVKHFEDEQEMRLLQRAVEIRDRWKKVLEALEQFAERNVYVELRGEESSSSFSASKISSGEG